MRVSKLLAAVAGSLLVAAPAMANPAAPLSVTNAASVKAKTSASKSNKIGPEVIVGLGLIAGGILAVALIDNEDSDSK